MDNYEEYFLLYVDNELTAAEKRSVEQFIAMHPELQMELDMLMDTRLPGEQVHFEGKDMLMKSLDKVNEDNIGELQLLMLDDELDASTLAETEAYMLRHPEAAKDFEVLQKTKLPAEHIIFPYKDSLYKTEKKPAGLFYMHWTRVAVAAAILVTAGLLWLNRQPQVDAPVNQPLAGVEKSGNEEQGRGDSERVSEAGNVTVPAETTAPTSTEPAPRKQLAPVKENTVTIPREDRNTYAAVDNEPAVEEPIAVNTTSPSIPEITAPAQEPVTRETTAMQVKTNYASDALASDNSSDEEYAEDEHRQRKGLRGIVRKVNRFYNKATNPDPDKATVKVASFEIGLQR